MTTAAAAAVAALPWIAAAQAQGPGAPPPHGRDAGSKPDAWPRSWA